MTATPDPDSPRRFGWRSCLVGAALSLVMAPAASAQYRDRLLDPPRSSLPPAAGVSIDRRSPVLAGSLSFVLPLGTGSFYAGHVRHGVTHLLVAVASVSGMLVGTMDCIFSGISGREHVDRSCGVAKASAWVFVANWGWGVVSAVHDANAHNRRVDTAATHQD